MTMAQQDYRLNSDLSTVTRASDGAIVPVGQPTADSRAYADWLAAGGVPAPVPDPTPQQRCAEAMAGGCAIVSTSMPEISATYPTDPQSLSDMHVEASALQFDGTFTDGTTTWTMATVDGKRVTLTAAQFTVVRKAIAEWVTAWRQSSAGVTGVHAPSSPVTVS